MEVLLYKNIAAQLEDCIKDGTWKVNEKIPSERELATHYQVSRTVIREAIKTLNEKQLVVNRPGKGNYVSIPNSESFISQFESLMDYNNISLDDLINAREEIEITIGKLAVQNYTHQQMKEIKSLYEEMNASLDDGKHFNSLDYAFHLKLAESSGNKALQMIFASLYSITGSKTFSLITSSPEMRKHAQHEHLTIINALKSRSKRNMTKAIQAHMDCIKTNL